MGTPNRPLRSVLLSLICIMSFAGCQGKPVLVCPPPILAPDHLKYHQEEWDLPALKDYRSIPPMEERPSRSRETNSLRP